MRTKHFCERRIKGIAPHSCGLTAVKQISGKWLCGGCITIEKRNATKRANKRTAQEEYDKKVAGWTARAGRAAEILGIESVTLSSFMFHYFEAVVIPLSEFERLADGASIAKSQRQ